MNQTALKPKPKRHFSFGLNTLSLFKEKKVIQIKHAQETYYLRLTKNNKLILTK